MIGEYLYKKVAITEGTEAVIVIDAGHGGFDPGKVGVNQALEKDINLQIAKKLEQILKEKNVKVIMTREEEERLADSNTEDLKERVRIINKEKPTLAVSIHQNSYSDKNVQGAQVFYYKNSEEGEKAAVTLQEALLAVDSENARQAKANDTYYMLKKTEAPLIIVECGFLSNPKEAEKLVKKEYQQKLAEALSSGILEYLML